MKNENNFREWYKKFEVFVSLQVIKLYVAINTEYNYAGYVLLQFALLSYPMNHQKKTMQYLFSPKRNKISF